MKKSLAILLVLMLVVGSLAGCGGNEPAETGEPVKLVIAARGGSHVDVINSVIAQFEADNNCTVEILGLEAADLKQKVSLDAKNEKGAYDLMMIDDPWMPEYAQAGMMLNLTEAGYEEDDDFVNASKIIGMDPYGEGDTYALPFAGNVTLLFYNQGVLDAAGSDVPDNWADVLEIAKAVNGKDGKIGYVIRGQQGNPIVGDFMPILSAFGGDIFDKDWNVTVNSPEAVAALNLYKELLANGVNYEKNDIVSSVADGKAAMSLGWPSWFLSPQGSMAGYARIPGKMDASSADYPSGVIGNWMMAVTANSPNPELAMSLLQYLTSADTQKLAADAGAVPTRISVFTDPDLSAKYPFYATLMDATENSRVRPRTPLWSEIENVFGIELSNAISDTKTVEQALADSQTAIEGIMQ